MRTSLPPSWRCRLILLDRHNYFLLDYSFETHLFPLLYLFWPSRLKSLSKFANGLWLSLSRRDLAFVKFRPHDSVALWVGIMGQLSRISSSNISVRFSSPSVSVMLSSSCLSENLSSTNPFSFNAKSNSVSMGIRIHSRHLWQRAFSSVNNTPTTRIFLRVPIFLQEINQ